MCAHASLHALWCAQIRTDETLLYCVVAGAYIAQFDPDGHGKVSGEAERLQIVQYLLAKVPCELARLHAHRTSAG